MEEKKSKGLSIVIGAVVAVVLLGSGIFVGYKLSEDKTSLQGNSLNNANNSTGYNASDSNASDANASDANASAANVY